MSCHLRLVHSFRMTQSCNKINVLTQIFVSENELFSLFSKRSSVHTVTILRQNDILITTFDSSKWKKKVVSLQGSVVIQNRMWKNNVIVTTLDASLHTIKRRALMIDVKYNRRENIFRPIRVDSILFFYLTFFYDEPSQRLVEHWWPIPRVYQNFVDRFLFGDLSMRHVMTGLHSNRGFPDFWDTVPVKRLGIIR